MNRAESKYFNTAAKMDEAFLGLLDEKEFQYITVKEICQRAGVHRSTFYLHYETVSDLLDESLQIHQREISGPVSRRFGPYGTPDSGWQAGRIISGDAGVFDSIPSVCQRA